MELVTRPLKRYWRRKGYQRIETGRKNIKVTRFGGNQQQHRFWKIKPKLRLRIITSPLKLLRKMKDAYLDMMVRLAGSVGYLNTNNNFGNKRIPKARQAKVVYSSEEVENRLVYEIYKAMMILNQGKQVTSVVP